MFPCTSFSKGRESENEGIKVSPIVRLDRIKVKAGNDNEVIFILLTVNVPVETKFGNVIEVVNVSEPDILRIPSLLISAGKLTVLAIVVMSIPALYMSESKFIELVVGKVIVIRPVAVVKFGMLTVVIFGNVLSVMPPIVVKAGKLTVVVESVPIVAAPDIVVKFGKDSVEVVVEDP